MSPRSRLAAALLAIAAAPAAAQVSQFRLDENGQWVAAPAPEGGRDPDAAVIAEARELLAADNPDSAWSVLSEWIEKNERGSSPYLPQAYLLRGDAKTAAGNEYKALYDYEAVIKGFPQTEEYVLAIRRELEIAIKYVFGMRHKWMGLRWSPADHIGEELLVRVQERLPGSPEAERAGIELADYYYRNRDLKLAETAYQLFVENYPRSQHVSHAKQRRIYANIAQFSGPQYDASGLKEAKILIEDFAAADPVAAQRLGLSDALIARLDESAAAQVLEKARWYIRRGDLVSARMILQRVATRHAGTVAAQTAIQMLEDRGWPISPSAQSPAQPGDRAATAPAAEPAAAPASPPAPAPEPTP